MTESLEFGAARHTAILKRSARARRMTLRVSRVDRRVTLSLPKRVGLPEAQAFLDSQIDWVESALDALPQQRTVSIGSVLPIEGVDMPVVACAGRGVSISKGCLHAPEHQTGHRVQAFLKVQARERLADATDRYATRLGRSVTALTLRDTRSRWGSCTSTGRLMFSWRLIMAPPDVLEYVAAHEVAHLEHMDHSKAFWSAVEDLYGSYRVQRKWLRDNGATLHQYRFTD